jgi:hypothetical protein
MGVKNPTFSYCNIGLLAGSLHLLFYSQERIGPVEGVMAVNYKALLKDLLLND